MSLVSASLPVLPAVTDATVYNVELQPATNTRTNALYIAPVLQFIPATSTLQPNANATASLGGTTNYWGSAYINSLNCPTIIGGTFTGVATTAKYADLAENYTADADYAPGTVLVFGGDKEVTISTQVMDRKVAGVVSTDPAYLMNSNLTNGISVALTGRVPCSVVGTIVKGDMLVTSNISGVATSAAEPAMGSVIGKALESYDSTEVGTIEVVVGRL